MKTSNTIQAVMSWFFISLFATTNIMFAQIWNIPDENEAFRRNIDQMTPPIQFNPQPLPQPSYTPIPQNINTQNINNWLQYAERKRKAIDNENWTSAIRYARQELNAMPNVSINNAKTRLQLSMLLWNNGDRYEAKKEMQICFNILRNDPNIFREGFERAEKFLEKMKDEELPRRFTSNDINRSETNYLFGFIMEIAERQWNQGLDRSIERNRMMESYFSSMSKSYKLQADYEASRAVQSADYDYRKETKMDFDPGKRPESPSARRAWESCNRIHEIFCR